MHDRMKPERPELIKPCEELSPYVRYYWVMEYDAPFKVLTFPIGCPQLIFHRGEALYIPELGTRQCKFTISGQVNFPAHIQSDGRLEMIVAVFRPHTIGLFIDTPPYAFYNREIPGYDIENRRLNALAERIFECENTSDCIRLLEQWLLSRINPTLNTRRIACTLQKLFENPSITIGCLAEEACLGKKQYERVFRDCVGMNPKEYARIVKFQKAMEIMQCGDINFAAVAAESGYADQSHFIREFKKMSGHTPNELQRLVDPYSDLFTNPV